MAKIKLVKIGEKFAVQKRGIFFVTYIDLKSTQFSWFRTSSYFKDCLTDDENLARSIASQKGSQPIVIKEY